MPFATFTRVREVSSEDKIHLAENLIKSELGKKWKTKNAGEKSAYVILEMSGSYQIKGIDIGNEHSAFVEVLVGKSSCAPDEFKEILITCSLMTPIESKSSNNINRVRCFNQDALVPSVAEDKWSLVKILCTQPFNKHVSYGLSFIKIHIDDTTKSSIAQQNLISELSQNKIMPVIGSLKFRKDSSDSDSENSSSLFNRWKKSKDNGDEPTTAAAIRTASKNPTFNDDQKPQNSTFKKDVNIPQHSTEKSHTDKKRSSMDVEKEVNKKARKSLDYCPKSLDDSTKNLSISKKTTSEKEIFKPSESIKDQPSTSQGSKVKDIKSSKLFRPFNELLKGVVLVISGIQNPDRADLRNKAIALGAKYKADWDDTCTHLICAFKNTPKYNQVKGKGKIVTRSWIEKCYSLKKYLPWRRYALDSKDLSKPESDEEIFDNTHKSQMQEIGSNISSNLPDATLSQSKGDCEEGSTSLALYDIDGRSDVNNLASGLNSLSSESDTDDEIKKIEQRNINTVRKDTTSKKVVDIYEASTDEEDYIKEKLLK